MRHLAFVLLLALGACSTTTTSLPYAPTVAIQPAAKATIGAVAVTDARTERNPTWLGTIRSGYGQPMKTLVSERPVKDEVATAFRDALLARGMLAPGEAAPYRLDVTVNGLSCNQFVRRDGRAVFALALVEAGSNRTVHQDMADKRVVTGSLLALDAGAFGSVEKLREVQLQAMSEAIDQLLTNPAFVAAATSLRVAQVGP